MICLATQDSSRCHVCVHVDVVGVDVVGVDVVGVGLGVSVQESLLILLHTYLVLRSHFLTCTPTAPHPFLTS